MTDSPDLTHGREYHERGVVLDTFPLADPTVIADLLVDARTFEAAVRADRAAGRRRVPYRLTDAIRRVAHDANVTAFVQAVLGADARWVMWGSNIQTGTPNQAGSWHVDLESLHWPSITVAVGLEGCSEDNSTRCIPFSHLLGRTPAILADGDSDIEALATTSRLDPRCSEIVAPRGFTTGRFYAFNARIWHAGEIATSAERTMLFLHYHAASDPRVPLMVDYERKVWSREPAPFIAGPAIGPGEAAVNQGAVNQGAVNTAVYRPPTSLRRRAARLRGRIVARTGPVARWIKATAGTSRP